MVAMEEARASGDELIVALYDCSKAYDVMEWFFLEDGLV
jgi:hypothetical protein